MIVTTPMTYSFGYFEQDKLSRWFFDQSINLSPLAISNLKSFVIFELVLH